VGAAQSSAMWSDADLSEQVTKGCNSPQNLERHGSKIWRLFCALNMGNNICFNFTGNNCNQLKTVSNRDTSNWLPNCHDALCNRSSQGKDTVHVTGQHGRTKHIIGHHGKTEHTTGHCVKTQHTTGHCVKTQHITGHHVKAQQITGHQTVKMHYITGHPGVKIRYK
jgi:hypothetical protein